MTKQEILIEIADWIAREKRNIVNIQKEGNANTCGHGMAIGAFDAYLDCQRLLSGWDEEKEEDDDC